MAAKVKYLIDKCNVRESEIAVISFTNKATEEIEDRIKNFFGYKNVDVYTFHKLGLKILRSSGKDIVNIVDEGGQYKIIANYIKEVLFKQKEFFEKFNNAFKSKVFFKEEYMNFTNFKDYHDNMYKKKMENDDFDLETYINTEIEKRRNMRKTINGEYTKSKEEVDIANFLYINGIDYEYEKTYDKCVGDNRSYKPDFHISQLDKHNYIEHFGIDLNNNKNSMFTESETRKYLNSMKLKELFHNEPDNYKKFIVTYSKYRDEDTYITHLEKELLKFGYSLLPISSEKIYYRLRDTSEDTYFSQFIDRIVIPFIKMFKGRNYNENDLIWLKEKAHNIGIKDQIDVIEEIYNNYQGELQKQHRIDFEDMINMAYSIIPKLKEANIGVDYNYIIIDEYQDISMQRYNLTKRISDLFEARIMAVGDDWQSIFGFAGSDITMFTEFSKYLNGAMEIPIVNTYRNSQELIDIAGEFVQKNTHQIEKQLKSIKHLKNPVEIYKYDDNKPFVSDYTKPIAISNIIEKICSNNPNGTILLMGRYKNDINTIIKSDMFTKENKEKIVCKQVPNANIEFLTIHSSKGLGYDNCILINASNEKYGFPSLIEDEPIIRLIKPKIDEEIDYPEERRLFYVALTRTKNKLYVVSPVSHISSFVEEIKDYENVIISEPVVEISSSIKTNFHCSKCGGKLEMFKYKNSDYYLYECENKCGMLTSMPSKQEIIERCPQCNELMPYRYTDKNENKIYKCLNNDCNYKILKQ
jgi:DNA helicase-4